RLPPRTLQALQRLSQLHPVSASLEKSSANSALAGLLNSGGGGGALSGDGSAAPTLIHATIPIGIQTQARIFTSLGIDMGFARSPAAWEAWTKGASVYRGWGWRHPFENAVRGRGGGARRAAERRARASRGVPAAPGSRPR